MSRASYASDLTEEQYQRIEPLLPAPKTGGRPIKHPRHDLLNAILYVVRTGCAWRLLPHDLPNGTWKRVHDKLRGDVRKALGRHRQPSAGIIDSQSGKTTERGGRMATTPARRSMGANATCS